jgi:predicted  nucleic acid-binding Zn-ribbon protein
VTEENLAMGPVLNSLIMLQSVENRLRAVKAKLSRCRRNVILQENQVRSLQNTLEAKKEELTLMRVQADRLELELKSRDESISKLRAMLNMAKTNKEYAAVLTQLNTSKADNAKIENQILDLMKSIEADQAQCTEVQSQIEEQKQKLSQVRSETENAASKYETEMAEIQAEWEQLAEKIPPEPLRVFKRVAETYDGEALAIAERQDGRVDAFTCGGCFMGLTTETANMLMTKDDIIRCPNCTRILVIETSES